MSSLSWWLMHDLRTRRDKLLIFCLSEISWCLINSIHFHIGHFLPFWFNNSLSGSGTSLVGSRFSSSLVAFWAGLNVQVQRLCPLSRHLPHFPLDVAKGGLLLLLYVPPLGGSLSSLLPRVSRHGRGSTLLGIILDGILPKQIPQMNPHTRLLPMAYEHVTCSYSEVEQHDASPSSLLPQAGNIYLKSPNHCYKIQARWM